MSALLILIFYFAFFCWGFHIYDLPKKLGLSLRVVILLFGVKVIFGCLNLYFHNSEYIATDAHNYYTQVLEMLTDFPSRPVYYLNDWIFNWSEISTHLNILDKSNAIYWSDIGRLFHQRFLIVTTILSFGHEYVNIVFYNVFFFIGLLGLYKTFIYFKPDQKWIFILIIFFIPSITFWCSAINKDGFVLSLIGYVSWATLSFIKTKTWRNTLLLIFLLFLLLVVRYFYFLIFFPLFLLFFLVRKNRRPFYSFLGIVLIGICGFLFINQLIPGLDLMQLVVKRQQEFLQAKGYSDLMTPELENNAMSFISSFPIAISHIFIEPIQNMGNKLKYDLAAFDSILILVLIFIALIKLKRKNFSIAFLWVLLFYSVICLIFIGYTIPNLGAIVRYESPFICLLLLSLFALGNFEFKRIKL